MTTDNKFEIQIIPADRLWQIEREWESLAGQAIEFNPFYEHWMIRPALEAVGIGQKTRIALIWFRNSANANVQKLTGVFPFIPLGRWKSLPVSAIENLSHIYCFSGVPLLHREHSRPALDAYFDWLSSPRSSSRLMIFHGLPVDGKFHQLLVDLLHSRSLTHSIERRYTRALYRCPKDPHTYIATQFSGRALKHLRRQKELLSEQGTLEVRHLSPEENITSWLNDFLRLEAAGWKGVMGTALSSVDSHETFFKSVTQAAHGMQRLKMSGLWLDGNLVAARTAFRAGTGSFLFKIAYDEIYAKYSPGKILELECILAGEETSDAWEDSCTSADNLVYRKLWQHRRTIEDIVISCGSTWGDLSLSLISCLRFVKSRLTLLSSGSRSKTNHGGSAKS